MAVHVTERVNQIVYLLTFHIPFCLSDATNAPRFFCTQEDQSVILLFFKYTFHV